MRGPNAWTKKELLRINSPHSSSPRLHAVRFKLSKSCSAHHTKLHVSIGYTDQKCLIFQKNLVSIASPYGLMTSEMKNLS